jgi:hypothetical protein
MGHPLTYDEQEILEDIAIHYKNNKKIFLRDVSLFLFTSALLFYFIILFQN